MDWTRVAGSGLHGIALGLVFVLVSTLLEIGMSGLPLSLAGAFTAQTSQPLLWIVDSAPIVLGIFGAMIGTRERELREARRDIVLERAATVEVVAAKEAAESANRVKSEFLANMSHEIRTPMNGVLGMTNLVLETDLTDQQRQFMEAIDESAKTLLSIINDLLDFSKVETGKLELRRAPFALSDTLTTPLKALAAAATEKGLDLIYEEDEALPRMLVGDRGRVGQIFLNLIDNGIKFTEEGEVVVRLALEGVSDEGATIVLTVRDTGIGIDEETKDHIFEAFSQEDGSHTRRFGGTGLGLTISSRLLSLMGGRLMVDSVVGEGSTFRAELTLPVAAVFTDAEATSGLAGKRVLVVDDNPTSRHAVAEYLERWSVVAIPAESATAALETARVMRAAGRPIDAVLADLRMPYAEDLPLYERIEKEPEFGRVKVIAILSGRLGDHARVVPEEWMASHLDKPVFPDELAAVLLDHFRSTVKDEEGSAQLDTSPLEHVARRVLVAEDDRVNQMLAVGLLERRGYAVTIAPNGAEAVECFEREDFDFVLMDVQMPVMDGLEATQRIRELEEGRLQRMPIIAVTAHSMKGDREKCLAAGMDDYVAKPIEPGRLYDAIDRRFPSRLPEFEPGRALDLVSGDKERFASVAKEFLEEAPGWLGAIHEAYERNDTNALSETARSMAGTANRMSMPRLRDIAHRIGVLSSRGDFEEAAALMAELDAAVGSGTSAIKRSIDAA